LIEKQKIVLKTGLFRQGMYHRQWWYNLTDGID